MHALEAKTCPLRSPFTLRWLLLLPPLLLLLLRVLQLLPRLLLWRLLLQLMIVGQLQLKGAQGRRVKLLPLALERQQQEKQVQQQARRQLKQELVLGACGAKKTTVY